MSDPTELTANIIADIKDDFESRRFLHGHRESVTESLGVVVGVHVFDTIDRLTRELAEARDKALEEAAAWHDKQAKHLASISKQPNLYEPISDDISSKAVQHMAHACAIRRLKEKL